MRLTAIGGETTYLAVISGDTIYSEPHAYELRTGKRCERPSPFTGEAVNWDFDRSYDHEPDHARTIAKAAPHR